MRLVLVSIGVTKTTDWIVPAIDVVSIDFLVLKSMNWVMGSPSAANMAPMDGLNMSKLSDALQFRSPRGDDSLGDVLMSALPDAGGV